MPLLARMFGLPAPRERSTLFCALSRSRCLAVAAEKPEYSPEITFPCSKWRRQLEYCCVGKEALLFRMPRGRPWRTYFFAGETSHDASDERRRK